MGVRNTMTEGKVALFDSVTGVAFGPVFDTEEEAERFVAYVAEHVEDGDVRSVQEADLMNLYDAFTADSDDG